jgi:hypothetical protein
LTWQVGTGQRIGSHPAGDVVRVTLGQGSDDDGVVVVVGRGGRVTTEVITPVGVLFGVVVVLGVVVFGVVVVGQAREEVRKSMSQPW